MRIYPALLDDRQRALAYEELDNAMEEVTASFQSTVSLKSLSDSFKTHVEKSVYRVPAYIIPSRVNASMNMGSEDFQNVRLMRNGGKSEIYSAKARFCPVVAIKKANKSPNSGTFAESEIINEIQCLMKIKHESIIAIKGARVSVEPFVVLEHLAGGTLSEVIERFGNNLPPRKALDVARQLISALKYLHEDLSPYAMIVHRDLHPQNIGFTAGFKLKLFDFGKAAIVKKRLHSSKTYKMSNIDGNLLFMAPEALNNQPYNEKVDIFSFGVILRRLLTGDTRDCRRFQGYAGDVSLDRTISAGVGPQQPLSTVMELLIDQCTMLDYYLRPSCSVILGHLEEELQTIPLSMAMSEFMARWGLNLRAVSSRVGKIFPSISST